MGFRTTIKRALNPEKAPSGEPVRATWRGAVLAESADTLVVEGNDYFPAESVRWEHLRPSASHTVCPWKGVASYHDVVVDGEVNPDAAWYYPTPSPAATRIKDRVAFWRGVEVGRVIGSDSGAATAGPGLSGPSSGAG